MRAGSGESGRARMRRHGWAVSSAVEHYVDIVVATGSIPVPPTIFAASGFVRGFSVFRRTGRAAPPVRDQSDEGSQFAARTQDPASRLPSRAPQGPHLRHQQDESPLQGASGLIARARKRADDRMNRNPRFGAGFFLGAFGTAPGKGANHGRAIRGARPRSAAVRPGWRNGGAGFGQAMRASGHPVRAKAAPAPPVSSGRDGRRQPAHRRRSEIHISGAVSCRMGSAARRSSITLPSCGRLPGGTSAIRPRRRSAWKIASS